MYLLVVWHVISEWYDRNYLEVCYETRIMKGGTVSIDGLSNVCLSPSFGLLVVVDTQLNHAQPAWRRDTFEVELEILGGDISLSLLAIVCLNHLMDLCRNLNLG